jgi:hypothetical protein
MVSYYIRGHQTITPERETQIWRALEELSERSGLYHHHRKASL